MQPVCEKKPTGFIFMVSSFVLVNSFHSFGVCFVDVFFCFENNVNVNRFLLDLSYYGKLQN